MAYGYVLLAVVIAAVASTASAQTATPATGPGQSPAPIGDARDTARPGPSEARNLIGRSVESSDGDPVGKIESVHVASDGKVGSVVVDLGDHEVQVARKDLQTAGKGDNVTVGLTKDQLRAMAPYRYEDESWRGKVFGEDGVWSDDRRPTADTDRTVSTGDFNLAGAVSVSAVLGARIRNTDGDTVGTVEDLFVDDRGAISTVVVSVGGSLGVGARSVGVKGRDIRRTRDGNSVVLVTALGKDELEALPPYIAQLRKPAPGDQAAPR
jgi:sporulation protein YlmC with PRC-barrel domain